MRGPLNKWTRPETVLSCLEMPIMLTICALQLGLALSIVDAAIWRVAMAIPFTCAGMVLFAAIYAAIRYADDWA